MTNKLIRVGSTNTTPAVPYQPARPAYSWTETIYGNTLTINPNGWVVVPPSDRDLTLGGDYSDQFGPQSGDVIHTGGEPAFFNNTTVRTVVHNVPATPEVLGTPAIRTDTPPVGWTSFAHSQASIPGTGVATWKAARGGYAIAVGLAQDTNPTVGYTHITHGLLFTGGKYYNLRDGTLYGDYTNADEFGMTVLGGVVRFTIDDVVFDTEASTYPAAPLVLSAAMFGVGDHVDEPTLVGLYGGGSASFLPMLSGSASEDTYGYSSASLPALLGAAGMLPRSDTTFPSLQTLASNRAIYGQAIGSLSALTAASYGGTLTVVVNNSSDTSLPFLAGYGLMLTGGNGQVNPEEEGADPSRSLPMPTTIGADHTYGFSASTLPALLSLSYTEPADEAYLFETILTPAPLEAGQVLVAVMVDGVQVGSVMVPDILLDAAMLDIVACVASAYTSQLLDAIMMAIVNSGAFLGMPSAMDETWAVNLATSGSTSYSGYPFNSYAKIGDRYFGASSDGIALLEGDNDDGAPIRASVNLGKLDFGTQTKKTVSHCYIGMSAKGNLFLKITAEGRDFLYKTRSFSEEMQQQRVTLGKGLRTNYVWLELYNEDGTDFEIDTVQFLVADMTRKV